MLRVVNQQVHGGIEALVECLSQEENLLHEVSSSWPVAPGLDLTGHRTCFASHIGNDRTETAHKLPEDGIGVILHTGGQVIVRSAGKTPQLAAAGLDELRELAPRGENPDREVVPVMFWTYTPNGARGIRRDLDAATWEAVAENYAGATRPQLERLMDPGFTPGLGGQLILWNGDPGTGKTTAIRALARQWREWCDCHYIVDPDRFFGTHADYMLDVFMGGHFGPEDEQPDRWRLLILEDCGEMLQPDARRDVGQALSRFLNACDGMIGRGLRILVLVTTNEPIDKLHDAVSRPGRCAARIEFERFSPLDARLWIEAHDGTFPEEGVTTRPTLADLYGAIEGFGQHEERQPVGFAR